MPEPTRSQGATALAKTGATQQEIARRVGVSHVAVSGWLRGAKLPGVANRAKLLERYGILESAWEVSTSESRGPTTTTRRSSNSKAASADSSTAPAHPQEPHPSSVHSMATELEHAAQTMMRGLNSPDGNATDMERAKVMSSLVRTLKTVAELTGQLDVGKKLLKLPQWKRLDGVVFGVLRAFPEAAEALQKALLALEDE